jgi:acetylglutamate kinase
MQNITEKASVLHEALPYIRRFHGRTFVVKYGGHAMLDAELKTSFAKDICLLRYVGIQVVVVHGGGPQINTALEKMGVGSTFVSGLRITDDATMDVVEMVLAGQVNQEIVGLICHQGGRAVGLSGKDDGFIRARRLTRVCARAKNGEETMVDPGRVGEVRHINPEIVDNLMRSGFIPVVAPLGVDEEDRSLNINADTVAGKIAEALKAEKLIVLTDVEGLYADWPDRSSLVSRASAAEVEKLLPTLEAGMVPKMEACLQAVRGGVPQAHVVDGRVPHSILLEVFTSEGVGTMVLPDE